MNSILKKEKEKRRIGGDIFFFKQLHKKILLGRLEYYKSIQEKIPETKYKLEDPIGFQADREINKISSYYNEIAQKEVLTKKQILRLLLFRKKLITITGNNLGRKIDHANLLLKQINKILSGE